MGYNINMTNLPNSNVIFDNVFTPEDIALINDSVEKVKSERELVIWDEEAEQKSTANANHLIYKVHADMGRLVIEAIDLPSEITEKVSKIAESLVNVRYISATYCRYSGEYGTPTLRMHKDRVKRGDSIHLCIDYKLDSNTDWPIIIEDQSFSLKNNQALGFYTNIQNHGRPEKKFTEDEYVTVLFFYFEVLEQA